LALSAGSPPGELKERLAEYRLFTDLGLDFAAGKAKTAFPGDGAEGEQAALALKLARGEGSGRTVSGCSAGDICAEAPGPVIDRGACIAGGYAVVPRIPAGNGGGEATSDLIAVLDSAGLCPYLAAGIDPGIIAELLTAATGIQFSRDKVMQAGRRINRFIRQA